MGNVAIYDQLFPELGKIKQFHLMVASLLYV